MREEAIARVKIEWRMSFLLEDNKNGGHWCHDEPRDMEGKRKELSSVLVQQVLCALNPTEEKPGARKHCFDKSACDF